MNLSINKILITFLILISEENLKTKTVQLKNIFNLWHGDSNERNGEPIQMVWLVVLLTNDLAIEQVDGVVVSSEHSFYEIMSLIKKCICTNEKNG